MGVTVEEEEFEDARGCGEGMLKMGRTAWDGQDGM